MRPTTARTVVKIRLGRQARQWGFLFGLCGGLVLAIASVGVMQVVFCKRQHPKADWVACLRPIITPKETK